MRRTVGFHVRAKKEYDDLASPIRLKLFQMITAYRDGETLTGIQLKKLTGTALYEFRVKHDGNIYRALSGRIKPGLIVVLIFNKKSQKIPRRIIKKALNRYRQVLDYYDGKF